MADEEERIALFLDYENLAIGARDALGGREFDFKPIADALAERGRAPRAAVWLHGVGWYQGGLTPIGRCSKTAAACSPGIISN